MQLRRVRRQPVLTAHRPAPACPAPGPAHARKRSVTSAAVPRIDWAELPAEVHDAIQHHIGPISRVDPVAAGRNSDLAAVVHTAAGAMVFAKGNRASGSRARTQHLEAALAPHVASVSPRLLWRVVAAGWDVLGFEHVPGRPADLSPGSADLGVVTEAIRRLAATAPPRDLPLRRIEDRWADYAPGRELQLLRGEALLHTDLHPDNILVTDTGAVFVDWAWPTLGAAWIEPACLALWLIASGHTPAEAEAWARNVPAYAAARRQAVDVFTRTAARLWAEIAAHDPAEWKRRLAAAAAEWSEYRTHC